MDFRAFGVVNRRQTSPAAREAARNFRRLSGGTRKGASGLLLETGRIFADALEVAKGLSDRVPDGADEGIGGVDEPVGHPQAVAARVDEARAAQVGQMPRCLWLGNTQALVDVADADLACQQQAEDSQPGRIAERLEERRHPVEWLLHMCVDKYSTASLDFGIRVGEYRYGE